MHSRNTTTADALHQAAVNTKNTNNLPTDLRHAHLEPTTGQSTMGTSGTSSGPVFHEQPHEQIREQPREMMSSQSTGQTKSTMTVDSVTRDAEAQIDAQVAEALAKSRQLNAQDQARLQSSIGSTTSNLEEQARQLKKQIDEEKVRAEEHVKRAQQEKLSATTQRQNMEEKAILEAAAARKIELEQKAMKLQKEIDEITRQKTAEMMSEKPGNLQFIHQHQDTAINAQLAGDIGHALDIAQTGRVTETTTGGDVQYHPVKVQTMETQAAQQAMAAEKTVQGPEVHQRQGGILHAMKTLITGQHDTPTTSSSTTTTSTTTKTGPVTTGKTYDEQSQWAAQSDKHTTAK